MFSHKHDLFCRKRGKAWLTGYSWHSRKAGRAKVGTEANLHLYVPCAGHGAALHLAGHPTTVPVLSPRTADESVLLQSCFSCPGLGGSLHFLVQDSTVLVSHSSQLQLGNIQGGGLWGGQDRRSGCSLPPTHISPACVVTYCMGSRDGRRSASEPWGRAVAWPQLIELYVECGRWDGSAFWRLEGAGLSTAVPARTFLCSLFQERYLQKRQLPGHLCQSSASRAAGEDPRMCSRALVNLLIPN